MDVLIKDMDMPKNCKECPFSDHEAWCLIPGDWRKRYYCPDNEVSDDCPLVGVPTPHGRLIDADELKRNPMFIFSGTIREKEIDEATTIIEAEE